MTRLEISEVLRKMRCRKVACGSWIILEVGRFYLVVMVMCTGHDSSSSTTQERGWRQPMPFYHLQPQVRAMGRSMAVLNAATGSHYTPTGNYEVQSMAHFLNVCWLGPLYYLGIQNETRESLYLYHCASHRQLSTLQVVKSLRSSYPDSTSFKF